MNQIIFKLENHVGENQPHKTQKKMEVPGEIPTHDPPYSSRMI